MLYFYSGTPGSGKSLRTARDILNKLTIRKQNVITNMTINYNYIRTNQFKAKINKLTQKFFKKDLFKDTNKKDIGKLYSVKNHKITVEFLYQYAMKFHVQGKEGQTLLIIDEAQMLFAPNTVKLKCQDDKFYRQKWLEFFTQHRHLGYNIILISQFDKLIDAQIRCLFEYNCIHRKVNNFGMGAIFALLKMSLFVQVTYWYGAKVKICAEFFFYSKKYSNIYNSYKLFADLKKQNTIKETQKNKKILA